MSVTFLKTIAETRAFIAATRAKGLSIGLVPTMGALHDGHGALLKRARQENGLVVATIFVNPIQFDRPEDLEKYPRDLEADLAFCDRLGVDAVFAPDAAEMYPGKLLASADVAGISTRLEGEFRPGHFRGVATVVAKLFNILPADRAYFGEKDCQQLAVIEKMAADLNFPIAIAPVSTVRESDGLAMSSRNRRLTPEQRSVAPLLYQALVEAAGLLRGGTRSTAEAKKSALAILTRAPEIRVEYFEIVDATFHPLETIAGEARITAAVWLGGVRLIDNVRV